MTKSIASRSAQAVAVHGVHVRGIARHQRELAAAFGQHAADRASQGARAQHTDLQVHSSLLAAAGLGSEWAQR
jgi:hypothetical protein